MADKWARRGVLGLGVATAGALVGTHWETANDNWANDKRNNKQKEEIGNKQDKDPDGPTTEDVPGYENQDEILQTERELNSLESQVDTYESNFDALEGTNLDGLLEQDNGVRVAENGSVSHNDVKGIEDASQADIQDPEYILSTMDTGSFQTFVDGDSNGKYSQQMFTAFGVDEVDVSSIIDGDSVNVTIGGESREISLLASDFKDAREAVEATQDLNVFASTHLATEQPVARPEALENLSEELGKALREHQEFYDQAREPAREVDQYENDISNSLQDARSEQDHNDEIKLEQEMENLHGYAEDVDEAYEELTGNVASNIGTLAATKELVDRASDKADQIFENSEISELYVDVDINGQELTGIDITEVRHWSNIDDETIGNEDYLEAFADQRLGTSVENLAYTSDGEKGYLVDIETGEYEEANFDNPVNVFRDLEDGVWDGNLEG